ncbi:MAG TPA: KpsF/GutQ family sugar-phosphate isomerase [Pseudolabrys sp.]|jgi:arabinose-5-phosphate isomerase|nr:KpsF/GutQ family sugar-phosphate isomerase [Pseudolabrys sp.]
MAKPKPAQITSDRAQAAIASALRTLEAEGSGVDALAAALRDGLGTAFAAAVDLIRAAQGRVIVTGMGKSGHVARKIASTLASTGTPAFFVHPSEASHGDLGMIANNDVILALSWSGETAELKNIADYSRRHAIKLIAMTAISESTLAKVADVVLSLPQAREACPHNLAPTTSSLVQLALGDALAIALLESHGFTAVDFGLLHPGGKLGTLLKAVRDLMHTGATMPLSPFGTRMSEAILEMTAKGFGCVGVTDARGLLVGIITDGDLRRHMRDNLLDARVEDVMTRAPKTVRPDQLLSETLDILNVMKVTALFAVEAGKPVGVIHVHDLLRAGTA